MRVHIMIGVAVAGALAAASVAPPPEVHSPPTVACEVQLTATAPPLGAIPLAFIHNQFQYCSVICPHVVEGVITVPIGAALSPVVFFDTLQTTGSLLRSIGAAATSVTAPARTAGEGIIWNDVNRVVPKAFNNLEVAVVELVNVGAAALRPGEFRQAVTTARVNIVAALNQPLPPPVPTETGAETLPQIVAVEAIKVGSALAFEAGELLLLGVVQVADAAAQELAQTGDVGAVISTGAAQANDVIATASDRVVRAVDTAVTNIGNALEDPFPSTSATGGRIQSSSAATRFADHDAVPRNSAADKRDQRRTAQADEVTDDDSANESEARKPERETVDGARTDKESTKSDADSDKSDAGTRAKSDADTGDKSADKDAGDGDAPKRRAKPTG
jgi:hypothetical protein